MPAAILSLGIIASLLLISEWLWRSRRLKGEIARKFVHIFVGSFIAFWPLYMNYLTIEILSLALFVVIYISRRTRLFRSIHSARQHSWGELLFPLCIGAIAALKPASWIFTTAVLHLALADGLAGVIGTVYGKKNSYHIFGEKRSAIGSFAFWFSSLIIVGLGIIIGLGGLAGNNFVIVLWLPLLATLLENISPLGADNLVVPLVVVGVLSSLT